MSSRFKSPKSNPAPRAATTARAPERQPKAQAAGARQRPQPQPPPQTPPSAQPVQLLKTHGAARFDAEQDNAPSGTIQANLVCGVRGLQTRLATITREAAQRKAAPGAQPPPNVARSQTIQRHSDSGVDAFRVPLRPKSGGQPLPTDVRAKMETAFGADFSDVRVHVGHEASRIGAIAYTWGSSIHFAPGHYNPHTLQGQKVLGHELWHVVQQKAGRVKNPFGSGVAVVQDHALEAEADRMGLKAALTTVVRKSGGE